ncbi:MAG: hypothetical protein IKG22_15975, partial [Atopobiaceae bacterium]|nr:hypothetical protein [Atopobiaceae bacterium]
MRAGKRGRLALSFLLAAQMAISSVPLPALAEAVDEVQDLAEGQVVDVQEEGASEGEVNQAPVEAQAVTDAQTIVPDDDGRSNEELFAGYVQERIDQTLERGDGGLSTQSATESTDGLSDVELKLYEILKTKIQEVTAGRDEGSVSTEFVVSFDELFGEDAFVFTAEDLGVESIFEGEEISAQALAEAKARVDKQGPNTSAVLNALIADCPYDLYWFDRIEGMQPSTQWSADHNGEEYVLSATGSEYKFAVAQEYSAGAYLVDTSHAGSIDTALANAQSIVSDNAEGSVYDRLLAYKDAICNRVAYNDDAADETTNTPYGNPWQLIWVFDDDVSTNVVCEGYSKAFKYLVDLTEDINATCYIATGTMAGGTGAGPHMWNIVTMDDGRNYLVDVTNCDEGSVGEYDKLFIAAPSSGSMEDGYSFDANGTTVTYVYDEDTKSTYSEGVLELSNAAYDGPSEDPIDDPSAEELTLDVAQHVSSDNYWVGRFTAPENGTYAFYSEGDADTFGELYADEELEESINSNDDAADRNFQIIQTLTAGQTVYVKARQYSDNPFECDVFVTKLNVSDLSYASAYINGSTSFDVRSDVLTP